MDMEYLTRVAPRTDSTILVAGAGGFIGGWLATVLYELGFNNVRCVDLQPIDTWHQVVEGFENRQADLSERRACREAADGIQQVFNLAADMGGMGFIENNKALCMLSVLINTNLIEATQQAGGERFFFSSSACVYRDDRQSESHQPPLVEADAYPAMPEDGYGWEKLFSERMVRHFEEDFGLKGRVARYHNVYGPNGTWTGGREKAPAAISRKVAAAKLSGNHVIEIWGDGQQTRSFTYIDDAVEGTLRLMWSDVNVPINVGSSEMVTINELVDITERIAGVSLDREYILDAPKGVRGRNSDNTLIKGVLDWSPETPLAEGMSATYAWVEEQVRLNPEQSE